MLSWALYGRGLSPLKNPPLQSLLIYLLVLTCHLLYFLGKYKYMGRNCREKGGERGGKKETKYYMIITRLQATLTGSV